MMAPVTEALPAPAVTPAVRLAPAPLWNGLCLAADNLVPFISSIMSFAFIRPLPQALRLLRRRPDAHSTYRQAV